MLIRHILFFARKVLLGSCAPIGAARTCANDRRAWHGRERTTDAGGQINHSSYSIEPSAIHNVAYRTILLMRKTIFAALLGVTAAYAAYAQQYQYPQIPFVGNIGTYLVQFRCGNGSVFNSLSCWGGPLTENDPMKWRLADWGSGGVPYYQIHDSWLGRNGLIYQNWSYSPFGPLNVANGDGGQRMRTDGQVASFDATRDGGTPYTQYIVGHNCGGDGWLVFDFRLGIQANAWTGRNARLSISPDPNACPPLGNAATAWLVSTISVPFKGLISGNQNVSTIVSEHYDQQDESASVNM